MFYKILKSKIHHLKVTGKNLYYDGSLGLSTEIMEKASLFPGESVLVINLSNGERFETYIIPCEEKGVCILNGGAARKGEIGDRLIVLSFLYTENPKEVSPVIIKVDEENRVS